ncbi:MAG: hypothetical protein WC150_08840 [Bacteroidia bacterium]
MNTLLPIKQMTKAMAVAAGVLLLHACADDFDKLAEVRWNPDVAVPLVNSSLTAADIITKGDKDGKIEVDGQKFCTLIYTDEMSVTNAEDAYPIQGQVFGPFDGFMNPVAVAAFSVAPTGGTASFQDNQNFNFSAGTVQIDTIEFKGGSITFSIKSTIQHDATVSFSFTGARKGSAPLTLTATLNAANNYENNNLSVNLEDYVFDMTNGGGQTNRVPVQITTTLTKGAGPLPTTSDKVTYSVSFNAPKFRRVHGDVGTSTNSTNTDTVRFALFKNSLYTGSIQHAAPRAIFVFKNSYGVTVRTNVNQMRSYIPAGPNAGTINVTGSEVSTPTTINGAVNLGDIINTSKIFDNGNSNIRTIINSNPEYLIYKLDFTTNPNGTPASRNFMLDTSRMDISARIELPLYGTANNFALEKEFDFEFQDTSNLDVEQVTIRTFINNGFPLDVNTQIYFLDQFKNRIDSLISPLQTKVARAASIDGNGKVIAPTSSTTDNSLNQIRWKRITTLCRFLAVSARLESAPTGVDVRIYSDYTLDVKLAMRAKLNVDLKEDSE